MADGTQLQRAVANTLWPYLRAGERGWTTYRELRVISPVGNPRSGHYSSARPPSTDDRDDWIEVLSVSYKIITTLWSEDWPGGESWRIALDKSDAEAAISHLNAATIADYELALEHATCRRPFQVGTDQAGLKRLTRNRNDGLITNLTAAALEAVAKSAELRLIPPEVEEKLFTDADEHISLNAIRAALQIAGETEN